MSFTLTISNFTPKPHTPFQWHTVSTEDFLAKQKLLREALRPLRNVKANFTDVRISAMEDFVGRGDRRLGPVLQRAWELGAGMDSWFESVDKAFGAWTQAINEAGLAWEMPNLKIADPLPWDHMDTGIDKQWLIEDWERALAAKVIPDCSFGGCSACGVCGPSFGHNVVIPPPEIPVYGGHELAEQVKVQRLRIKFGKLGEMRLISHLDLHRVLQRAARRANLPIAFSAGFNPMPRIAIAKALPLGYTSTGEYADFELTAPIDPEEFQQKLQAQLDPDLPIYLVEEVPLKSPSTDALLEVAEYTLTLGFVEPKERTGGDVFHLMEDVVNEVLLRSSITMEKTTKSGKQEIMELRPRLYSLMLIQPNPEAVKVHYIGNCTTANNLKPEQVVYMLNQCVMDDSDRLQLLQVHRDVMR